MSILKHYFYFFAKKNPIPDKLSPVFSIDISLFSNLKKNIPKSSPHHL